MLLNILIILGIVIDSKMTFSSHIDHITLKATRMLNFIKCNLCKCNKEIKCMAYLCLVRPSLEYAASAWDPYLIKDITAIEKIQRRAARWVTSNYDWRNGISITSTLADHKWPTLAQCRQMSRIGVFYQSIHQLIALRIPPHFNRTNRFTRHHHPLHFITPQTNTDNYKYSFFPRTICKWNNLPTSIIELPTLELFFNTLKFNLVH